MSVLNWYVHLGNTGPINWSVSGHFVVPNGRYIPAKYGIGSFGAVLSSCTSTTSMKVSAATLLLIAPCLCTRGWFFTPLPALVWTLSLLLPVHLSSDVNNLLNACGCLRLLRLCDFLGPCSYLTLASWLPESISLVCSFSISPKAEKIHRTVRDRFTRHFSVLPRSRIIHCQKGSLGVLHSPPFSVTDAPKSPWSLPEWFYCLNMSITHNSE